MTFAQLATRSPRLAELERDTLAWNVPQSMPAYSREFDQSILSRLKTIVGPEAADASAELATVEALEAAEDHLRIAWSTAAARTAEERRQPFCRAFWLVIQSEPRTEAPTLCDLRRLLKALLRTYSFRLQRIGYAETKNGRVESAAETQRA